MHEISTVNVNKTAIHVNDRASNFGVCPNTLRIKPDPIFQKTFDDERHGHCIDDN